MPLKTSMHQGVPLVLQVSLLDSVPPGLDEFFYDPFGDTSPMAITQQSVCSSSTMGMWSSIATARMWLLSKKISLKLKANIFHSFLLRSLARVMKFWILNASSFGRQRGEWPIHYASLDDCWSLPDRERLGLLQPPPCNDFHHHNVKFLHLDIKFWHFQNTVSCF